MYSFKQFLSEASAGDYNDEHAHKHVWNHMIQQGIAHDKPAMMAELEKAKKDKKHPLHFNNAHVSGFTGGNKTEGSKDSYHREIETAVHTVHALATHPDFKKAVKEKHVAEVAGATKGKVSDLWKKYGATKGATSKADIVIHHPDEEKRKKQGGIRLSMKKGGGSQLMSAGPEETLAVHHYAADKMLAEHPDYKDKPDTEKKRIHKKIMDHIHKVGDHLNAMKSASREEQAEHRDAANEHIKKVFNEHPHLNHYVRREATTGEGKFGENSPSSASYLVKSADGNKGAKVVHVNENDYHGSIPRASLPKGNGRSGNVKSDER